MPGPRWLVGVRRRAICHRQIASASAHPGRPDGVPEGPAPEEVQALGL